MKAWDWKHDLIIGIAAAVTSGFFSYVIFVGTGS